MEVFLTIVAVVVLIASIAQSRSEGTAPKPESLPSFQNNQDIATPTDKATPMSTIHPSTPPSSKSQAPDNQNMDEYIYPGSDIVYSSSQNLSLTSGDDPAKITSWYKAKIQAKNLNINSFVTTQANDKTLNKLVGGSAQISIDVEVSKESVNTLVNITIGITLK